MPRAARTLRIHSLAEAMAALGAGNANDVKILVDPNA